MGKRYYCDFCDKAFADNPTSRKNHINGSFHHRLRNAHYASFQDPSAILAAEQAKKPCRKLHQTGECEYGDNCKFSHMTEDSRRYLEEQCRRNLAAKSRGSSSREIGELDDWLAKRAKRTKDDVPSSTVTNKKQKTIPKYTLPPHLAGVPNLPPSLLPPTKSDFVNLPLLDWG